jgi:hypothetical protein
MSSDGWTTLCLIVGTAGRMPVWPAAGAGAGRPRVLVEAHTSTTQIGCSSLAPGRPDTPVI